MKHARSDYDHIQDPTGKIGDDEPVFLLRAKDGLAPGIVMAWAAMLQANGGDMYTVQKVQEHAMAMAKWGNENGVKLPDVPAEVLA